MNPRTSSLNCVIMVSAWLLSACGSDITAIRGATVLPANGTDPTRNATVVIDGQNIIAVGTDVTIPRRAKIVEADGKYIIPGMWDFHVHLSKTRPSAMKLFVVNGVTSIRDMGGDIDELLRWRGEVASGSRVGPTIYMAGSYLESPANIERMLAKPVAENVEPVERMRIGVRDPEHASEVVENLASQGVDLIKVRESVDTETFVAIGLAAREQGLRLMGHTMGVPLDRLVDAQVASIEHFFIPFLDDMPEDERSDYFSQFAALGTVFVPNLHLFTDSEQTPNREILAFLDDESNTLDPRRGYLSKYLLADWREQLEQDRNDDRKAFFERLVPNVIRDAKEMREAGVRLIPGTDTAVVFVFPGEALHEEVALYVDLLGYTPREAIEAATREAAEFMGVGDRVGTIEPGKVADLLILNADPLSDIRNTRDIDSVVLRGEILDSARLAEIRESIRSEPDIHRDDWGRYP